MRVPLSLGVLLLTLCGLHRPAHGQTRKPRFEPTDLEMEKPGEVELDLQFGPAFGDSDAGRRFLVPDFEVDIGLLPRLELDLDGAYSVDHPVGGRAQVGGDALWASLKLALMDSSDGVGLGLQLGPRLPAVPGMRGIGYEGLVLLGIKRGRCSIALNGGAFFDPGIVGRSLHEERPAALVFGLGTSLDLDTRGTFAWLAQGGTTIYLTRGHHELNVASGISYNAGGRAELSLLAVVGPFGQTDHFSLLVGVSPKFALF